MKRTASMFTILTVAMIVLISISFNTRPVKAEGEYSIDQVFHTVKTMYNGYVFINDTMTLNVTAGGPTEFLIGFPDRYGQSVLKCFAFSGSEVFPVSLNVPFGGRMGFYGVRVDFPHGAPQTFTVGFVLSNSLVIQDPQNESLYALDFPAYPSLVKKAGLCNVSIIIPQGALFMGGTVNSLAYGQELQEFTSLPARLVFLISVERITIVDIINLDRNIIVNEFGGISGVDTYDITNMASLPLTAFDVFLPRNASDPQATDQFGRKITDSKQSDVDTNRYEVVFNEQVESGKSSTFTVMYSLPGNCLAHESANVFALRLPLFEYENYYTDQAWVTITLPEGANVNLLEYNLTGENYSIGRGVYQETVSLNQERILVLDKVTLGVSYEYNPLWASFRPTMWVWAAAIAGCLVGAVVWQRPKEPSRAPVSAVASKLGPEYFRSFVDTYDEKKKIDLELDSLEARMEKGRIPRQRYRVLRRTLEARLSAVSRNLTEFKERMRAAGGQYSGLMLQLEVAEAEISEVKANIKNAETLHNRGELSLEAYRNRLADYQRKKEKAETTINGILLRIREEIR